MVTPLVKFGVNLLSNLHTMFSEPEIANSFPSYIKVRNPQKNAKVLEIKALHIRFKLLSTHTTYTRINAFREGNIWAR